MSDKNDKKLYVVDCNLSFEMVVAAASLDEANDVAKDYWAEDVFNGGLEPYTHARLATSEDAHWIETDFCGLDGVPFSNEPSQLTFEDYFAAMENKHNASDA